MEVRSNRIGDIRSFYRRKLNQHFTEKEADSLLFMILLEYTGLSKATVLTSLNLSVSESELLKIHFAVKELIKGKPIQYVLGKTEFYGIPFIVNSKVLIPRPETEELVERVLKSIPHGINPKILDIGTGSGCIVITLKSNLPDSECFGIDISEFALEVAQINAEINDHEISFKKMDISDEENWSALEMFDIIVSNPPYVRHSEKMEMKKNVLDYEPSLALFVPDDDPLVFYRYLAKIGKKKLTAEGQLFCEINQYLASETQNLFEEEGYKNIEVYKDHFGNFRVLSCIV